MYWQVFIPHCPSEFERLYSSFLRAMPGCILHRGPCFKIHTVRQIGLEPDRHKFILAWIISRPWNQSSRSISAEVESIDRVDSVDRSNRSSEREVESVWSRVSRWYRLEVDFWQWCRFCWARWTVIIAVIATMPRHEYRFWLTNHVTHAACGSRASCN